ncbi:tetratricopeptide repeat protein [Pseudochryseolinea flava]|uniref:MalT-like TPR region domain-containing protein n=1 Tax=Pseudochryseolinea flava TaxID=2059302 RepID=A0A364Y4F6_9BACT|nr:tetratricopeptide repeat protein [Pseudochryseolinea flava]RAW01656.1 hypothetical protein DQQ10_08355 [Pseudochryseolinea flava]
MNKCCLIFLLMVVNIITYAQNSKIDSLTTLLAQTRVDSARKQIYRELCYENFELDDRRMADYADTLIKLAVKSNDTRNLVVGNRILAIALRRLGNIDSAIVISNKIIKIAQQMNAEREVLKILNGLLLSYRDCGQYDLALRYGLETHSKAAATDSSFIVVVTNNIGLIYYKLENYSKAISYFKRSLRRDMSKDKFLGGYINLGLCYSKVGKFDSAWNCLSYVKKHVHLLPPAHRVHLKFSIAQYYFSKKMYDSAEVELNNTLALASTYDFVECRIISILRLAEIYLDRHDYQMALTHLRNGISITEKTSFKGELLDFYGLLGDTYASLGDYHNATVYMRRYISLKDSIYSRARENNISQIEIDFVEKEKNAALARQELIISGNRSSLKKRGVVLAMSIGFCLILILLAYRLYKLYKTKRLANEGLHEKIRSRAKDLETLYIQSAQVRRYDNLVMEKQLQKISYGMRSIEALCELALRDGNRKESYLNEMLSITRSCQNLKGK